MRTLIVIAACFCLFPTAVCAQDPLQLPSEPPEWGDVSPGVLRATDYSPDSSASAVLLADVGNVYFQMQTGGFRVERRRRIKILNEDAVDEYGTVGISYYARDDRQSVSDIDAVTYILNEQGEVGEHELDDDDIFTETVDANYERVRFAMPQVEPGAVIEYRYELRSEILTHIPEWYFQHAEPTLYSEYEVEVPPHLAYKPVVRGIARFDTVYTEETQVPPYGAGMERHWVMRDVPALRREPYMTTPDNYRARLQLQLHTVRDPGSGEIVERFAQSWPNLAQRLMDAPSFGDNLDSDDDDEERAIRITKGLETDSAKVRALYEHIRTTLDWNGKLRMQKMSSFDQILETNRANSAGVNLLLVSLLRHAGVQAHPALISTRSHGRMDPSYPLLTQFNSVIAVVTLSNPKDHILLDGTDPLCPVSLLPVRDLNRRAWLVREDNPEWIEVPRPSATHREVYIRGKLQKNGTLSGQLIVRDAGYQALESRRALVGTERTSFVQSTLLDNYASVAVSETTVENRTTLRNTLTIEANVSLPKYAQTAGGMMYLNPRIVRSHEENPFQEEGRSFPVDFAYPHKTTYVLTIRLPEGYTIAEVPANRRIRLPNGDGSYVRIVQAQKGQIMVRATTTINRSRFMPRQYESLRDFFSRLVVAQSKQIVLQQTAGEHPSESSGDSQ